MGDWRSTMQPRVRVSAAETIGVLLVIAACCECTSVQGWFVSERTDQLRVIAPGHDGSGSVLVLGSDTDGSIWSLLGEEIDSSHIRVNFKSITRASSLLEGRWDEARNMFWSDGDTWKPLDTPRLSQSQPDQQFDGVYLDMKHSNRMGANGFAGVRVVTDRIGKENSHQITIVGTESPTGGGTVLWTALGHDIPVKAHRGLHFDFTARLPQNPQTELQASFYQGVIEWSDGNRWVKLPQTKDAEL